jgi:hypothetical protein
MSMSEVRMPNARFRAALSGPVFRRMFSLWGLAALVFVSLLIYSTSLLWTRVAKPLLAQQERAPNTYSEAPLVGDPSMPIAERSVLGTTSTLSQEPLRLFLMAVQPGRTKYEGTAQMGTDPRNVQTMVAGARFANGARLAEIHWDRVILERDGKRIEVRVDQKAGIDAAGPQVVRAQMGISSAAAFRRAMVSEHAPAQTDDEPRSTSSGVVGDVNEIVRGQPVYRDTEVTGFSVIAGSNAGRFNRLGLEAGDVVTTVDGQPVAGNAQWRNLSTALLSGRSVGVTVERKGSLLALTLDGALAANDLPPPMPPPMPPPVMPAPPTP